MENRNKLLEEAYRYLEKHKKASFNEILKHVNKELNISSDRAQQEKVIGNLSTGMILDNHFFLKSDKLWCLRKQVSLDEIKSQSSSFVQDTSSIDLIDEILDETEDLNDEDEEFEEDENFDEEDETIYIAEDSYDDGDKEENLNLNKKVLPE